MTSLLWSMAVLLGQSVRWVHGTASLRVVAGVWFMTSLIIAIVYRSNLKAMLIMPRIHLPFDNLEELYQSQYLLYTTETSVSHRAVMNGFCYEYVMQGDRLLEGLSQALGFPKGSPLRPKVDAM
ncbi:hypothetical protein GWK47_009649 [Chionoecetes opilio]|uniref:Ionotropic glutamate receptor C-terminal domain-containing protein n=1 Tax=Chionoecetes opilio TaxID=41210 RepID=A0A8J5C3R9_CHIOP|nr:hypothetical protein GWK47_009649 [Chionoecetes opilio]